MCMSNYCEHGGSYNEVKKWKEKDRHVMFSQVSGQFDYQDVFFW